MLVLPTTTSRRRLSWALPWLALAYLVLSVRKYPAAPPELFQPACETEVAEPLVRSVVHQWLAGYSSSGGRMPIEDIPVALMNTTPLVGGILGPSGCFTKCSEARLRTLERMAVLHVDIEHCVVQREFTLHSVAMLGMDHIELSELSLNSACHWWEIAGKADVGLNATLAMRVHGGAKVVGVLHEVSRCLVGHAGALQEVVPPYESILLNGTLVSLNNLHVSADATVLANGCTVKAANLSVRRTPDVQGQTFGLWAAVSCPIDRRERLVTDGRDPDSAGAETQF